MSETAPPRLMVVSHDAGGAEIISSWLRLHREDWEPVFVLCGPARAIFARKLGDVVNVRARLPDLAGVDFLVCGSSGAATLEREAVQAARVAGVRSAVWLDHWTNYAARFVSDGTLILPDEVWVADEHAALIARRELPGARVRLRGNPYLEEFKREVHALVPAVARRRTEAERVLYVTEPTAAAAKRLTGDSRGWGYTEEEALTGYLDHLAQRGGRPVQLRLRTHPSEPAGKYDALLAAHATRFDTSPAPGATLVEDVAWADIVVGCDTMAMVAALAAGRRVVSVLPPGAKPISLPFPEIEQLFGGQELTERAAP
jgi:hypothetical protein